MLKIIFILLIFSFSSAKDFITFAPLQMEDRKTVYTQFYPMIQLLEKQLNKKIKIDYNSNYKDILKKFKQGDIDIAYLGPLPYITLKNEYPKTTPLVHFNNNRGKIFYTCSLVTFIDNNTEIKSIINKKIALTQPLSTCGYLSVNALLKKSQSSLENNKYKYIGRHDKVALRIIRGEFDFGGVKSSIAKKYSNLGLKEIAKTSSFPTFILAANSSKLSKETIKKITQILLNTKKDEYIHWGENIRYGCTKAKDENFDNLREIKGLMTIPIKDNFL